MGRSPLASQAASLTLHAQVGHTLPVVLVVGFGSLTTGLLL